MVTLYGMAMDIVILTHMQMPTNFLIYRYVYGGDVSSLNFEDADPLIVMADKYNVQGLVSICRDILIKQMSPQNVVRGAVVAYLTNDEILKDAAKQEIVNNGKVIQNMKDWEEVKKYPELCFEILNYTLPLAKRRKTQ